VTLPVVVGRRGGGVEADARDARHAALEDEADRRGLRYVIYGHHADDQAETLLLRLARGTGIDGLAGMRPVARRRLRPLLDVRREDVRRAGDRLLAQRAEVRAAGAAPRATPMPTTPMPTAGRDDPMNDDADLARVRLRLEVLPALARIGPDPVGALTRLAALAGDDADVLASQVAELRTSLPVVRLGRAVMLPSAPLRVLHIALARRLLRAALHDVIEDESAGPDAATVERMLGAPDGWRATLPGPVDACVDRGWHLLVAAAPASPAAVAPPAAARGATSSGVPLDDTPGAVQEHRESGVRLITGGSDAVRLSADFPGGLPPGIDVARLSVRLRPGVARGLRVRTRRDGDRIRTAAGSRSLGDVLGEVGVPRVLRDLLPVVTGEGDAPLWVPGVVVDLLAQHPDLPDLARLP